MQVLTFTLVGFEEVRACLAHSIQLSRIVVALFADYACSTKSFSLRVLEENDCNGTNIASAPVSAYVRYAGCISEAYGVVR